MATHSSILSGKIPQTEKPSGLQSMGSQRVRYDWATKQQVRIHPDLHGKGWWQLRAPFSLWVSSSLSYGLHHFVWTMSWCWSARRTWVWILPFLGLGDHWQRSLPSLASVSFSVQTNGKRNWAGAATQWGHVSLMLSTQGLADSMCSVSGHHCHYDLFLGIPLWVSI